jgi:hypothetical protein
MLKIGATAKQTRLLIEVATLAEQANTVKSRVMA